VLNAEGNLQLYYGCFVIRSQEKLILVDTGMGPGPHSERGNLCGDLMNQIRAKGLSSEEIDYVAHIHLHGDHVGWNVTGDGKASFPTARYLVSRADWDYFAQPRQLEEIASNSKSVTLLKALGIMDLVEGDHQIT
jgi:glyoxylase-like metal-dependent hydrolase (beta-lactamase superfamily II)